MPSREVSTSVIGMSAVPFVNHQNLGTVTDIGKILLGFCSQYIFRKCHRSVPRNSKQFWCSGEKTGYECKLPPSTCNARVNCVQFAIALGSKPAGVRAKLAQLELSAFRTNSKYDDTAAK